MADLDPARLAEEVLKPAQDGWNPTDNLFRTYLLPVGCADPVQIQRALDEVSRELGGQRLLNAFPAVIGRIRAGHEHAVEVLTKPQLREEHAAAVRQQLERLQATLRDRLAGGPGLPPRLVAMVVQESRGVHTRNEVREALAELRAAEQDPVELPNPPAPKSWNRIRSLLGELGVRTVFDYLASTPELSGAQTHDSQLNARSAALRLRRDAAKTSEANLIETLRPIIRARGLVDLLRFELFDGLGTMARYRYPELLEAAEANGSRMKALGISIPPRAVAYTVWCRQRFPEAVSTGANWRHRKRDALASGELRTAAAALASADKLTPDEQKELADLNARVEGFDADLARAAAAEHSDPELAARIYLAVQSQLVDPAVEAGLQRCRPAPARNVTALLDRRRVAVAWQPSTSTAGRIGYTVVRALGHSPIGSADGTEVMSHGSVLSVVDETPPAGHELYYAVFAVREGVAFAEPAVSEPLLTLAEASDFELRPAADAIRGRWTTLAEASGAMITRRIAGSDSWTSIEDVRRNDFTDLSARPGISYEYRLQLTYPLHGGRTAISPGIVVSGRCQEVPIAVRHLDARLDGEDVVVSWPLPPAGDVEIREVRGRAPGPSVVPVSALDQIGPPLSLVILRRRSELRFRPPGGAGSLALVAVTLLGDLAAIGPTSTLDRRTKPISDLQVLTRGNEIQLIWVWPETASEVRVLHRIGVQPSGPEDAAASAHQLTRAAYEAVGARFTLQPGSNFFSVCTTTVHGESRAFSPLTTVDVTSVVEVTYRITKPRLLSGRRLVTVGRLDGPVLPRLQLVARSRMRPMDPQQGVPLLDFDGGSSVLSDEFAVPRDLSRPVHLRLFALEPGMVLRAEQPAELIIQ